MSILLIQGPQGSGKTTLAGFIEEITQEGGLQLLLLDPFEPDEDLEEILLADVRGECVVLVTNEDPRNATRTEEGFNKVNEIIARATRITLASTP